MVINVGIYHDFRDLCPFFIDSYLLCIESFIIFASENDLCQTYTFLRELVFQSYISQKFRMWFKYGLKAQKLLPRARGFCPLPFRYAPVTVGSGRVELTSET